MFGEEDDDIDEDTADQIAVAMLQATPVQAGRLGIMHSQQAILIQALKDGNFANNACRLADIEVATFNLWVKKGELDKAVEPYKSFAAAVRKAEAEAIDDAVKAIHQARDKDWKAAAHFLKIKQPQEWGDKANTQIAVAGSVTVVIPDNGRSTTIESAND